MNPSQNTPCDSGSATLSLDAISDGEPGTFAARSFPADGAETDAGNSAMAQLDALHALVKGEGNEVREGGRTSSARATDGPEEPLDAYMKRFMERMTGRREEEVVVALPVQPEERSPSVAPAVEARQPARAPENSASLLQMRELANASSRSAIDMHQRRQLASNAFITFLPAAAVSVTSSGLAILALATGLNWQTGSATLFVVALALAWRFWAVRRRLFHSPN